MRFSLAPLAAVLVLGAVMPGLSACGFTPLYATGGTAAGLSRIDVPAIQAPEGNVQVQDNRIAYLLREQLNDSLARDRNQPPLYRLAITVTQRRDPRGLGPDNAASRYELSLQIDYALTEIASGKELTKGGEQVMVSYQAVTPPYAGVVAEQDGQKRAAEEAARRIRIDLAECFLNTKH